MSTLLIYILFTFVLFVLIWWYGNLLKWNKYLGKFRGPTPLPIIGSAHKFTNLSELFSTFSELEDRYGGVIKVFLGPFPRLFVADTKLFEFLLGSQVHIDKPYEYSFLHKWLGKGLLTSTGNHWRRQRKLITPTFHFHILQQFINVFNKQGRIFVENLRKEIPNEFDIYPYVAQCTLDTICESAMGTCLNAQCGENSDYVKSVHGLLEILMKRIFSIYKMWNFLFQFTEDYKLEKQCLKIVHEHVDSVIQSRRKELIDLNIQTKKQPGIKLAFLDLLLQANVDGNPLSNETIRDEVNTFMFEGYDTTSSGISFTLYCLSNNPEVQDKVIAELTEIFYDDPLRDSTYEDLQKMKYLEMVIKESMRLYPPVPFISRSIKEDVKFEGSVLPKGLIVMFSIYGLHRQKDVYLDPLKFDPERFVLENSQSRPPFAYVPFSAGPRNCIGQRFALLELKSVISKVLRHFEILPAANYCPILMAEGTLRSENGIMLRLKRRDFK